MTIVHCGNPTCAATITLGQNLANFVTHPPSATIVRKRTGWRIITENGQPEPCCPRCFTQHDN